MAVMPYPGRLGKLVLVISDTQQKCDKYGPRCDGCDVKESLPQTVFCEKCDVLSCSYYRAMRRIAR